MRQKIMQLAILKIKNVLPERTEKKLLIVCQSLVEPTGTHLPDLKCNSIIVY